MTAALAGSHGCKDTKEPHEMWSSTFPGLQSGSRSKDIMIYKLTFSRKLVNSNFLWPSRKVLTPISRLLSFVLQSPLLTTSMTQIDRIFMKSLGRQPASAPSWLSIAVWLRACCMSATVLRSGCLDRVTNTVCARSQITGIIVTFRRNECHQTKSFDTSSFHTEEDKKRGQEIELWHKKNPTLV